MKKEYIKPTMRTVLLESTPTILAGSNTLNATSGDFGWDEATEDTEGNVTAW